MGKRQIFLFAIVSFAWWQVRALPVFAQSVDVPSLTILQTNNCALISWPVPSQNFILQQNANLNPAEWTTVFNDLVFNPVSLQIQTSVPLSNRSLYFRLIQSPVMTSNSPATFQNLSFEQAVVESARIDQIDPAKAFPGWTISSNVYVLYNDLTLGSPAVDLMGSVSNNVYSLAPLQGNYSVLLQYFGGNGPSFNFSPPVMSQIGQIPSTAQSITFLVGTDPVIFSSFPPTNAIVKLNGVSIPLVQITTNRMAGNIPPWAGQIVQLTITIPNDPFKWLYFDSVAFSTHLFP